MLRTTRARPIASAKDRKRSSDDPDTAHSSGARAARKTWRRSSMSSVASCWGPQPPASSALSATSTWLTSPSASASSTSASSGRAASAEPEAATWSRAESASRAEPLPAPHRRLECLLVEVESCLGVDRLEQARAASPLPGGGTRGAASGCGWSAAPSAGRSWPGRTRRDSAAPPASSAARWPPRSTACGPRRRCRPSSGPACPAPRGPPGRAWRRRRCWRRRRARAR